MMSWDHREDLSRAPRLHSAAQNVHPPLKCLFHSILDNKYPIVYLNEPLPRTSTSQTATFRWTSNEMAYYKCAVNDTSKFVNCGSGTTGDWTTPPLSDGKHTFYLTAKDEVGNNAPRLSHSWNIGELEQLELRKNTKD